MAAVSKRYRVAQVLLTIGVLEFFGPIARDISVTHLLNPSWVGHARFHLAWALVFMGLSGLCNLYLNLVQASASDSRACTSLGLGRLATSSGSGELPFLRARTGVDGIVNPEFHLTIFGLNENVFAFVSLTTILLVSIVYLKTGLEPSMRSPSSTPS